MAVACALCITDPAPAWEHVHRVEGELPRRRGREDWTISHGWAVELSGVGFSTWTYFSDLPPAVVFAMSGRSSETFSGLDICRAAYETRSLGRDVRTLIVSNERVDRHSVMALEAIRIWPEGLDTSTVVWRRPRGHRAS